MCESELEAQAWGSALLRVGNVHKFAKCISVTHKYIIDELVYMAVAVLSYNNIFCKLVHFNNLCGFTLFQGRDLPPTPLLRSGDCGSIAQCGVCIYNDYAVT